MKKRNRSIHPQYLKPMCSAVALAFASSGHARIAIIEHETAVYEMPRSQIKTYIQRETIEANLKPVKAIRPGALSDEEVLAIPEKYLTPELKVRKQEAKKNLVEQKATKAKSKAAKELGPLKEAQVVKVRGKGNKIVNLRIDEAVWVPPTAAVDSAILAPQQKLPEVELLQALEVRGSEQVRSEIKSGDQREVKELFASEKQDSADRKPLLTASDFYQQGDFATALTLSIDVLSDPKTSRDQKVLARYLAAHSLFQRGFYASALPFLVDLVDSKLRRSAIGMAALALEKTREDGPANQILSKVSLSQIPDEHKALFSFHLGRILMNTGAREAALAAFMRVDSDHPRYPEAEYYMGVIRSSEVSASVNEKAWEDEKSTVGLARAHFEAALASGRTRETRDLLNLIRLSLARLAYQSKQFNQSVFLYNEVETTSPFSREAAYESAWSLYRIGEFNRALGVLHPLGSPYFESRDLAEIWILRSLSYLKLCRFDEARRAANTFESLAQSVGPELQEAVRAIQKANLETPSDLGKVAMADWIKNVLMSDAVVEKDLSNESLFMTEGSRLAPLSQNLRIVDPELRTSVSTALDKELARRRKVVAGALKPYAIGRLQDIEAEYRAQRQRLDFLRFEIYSQATKFPRALERPEAKKLLARGEFLPGVFLKGQEILWRYSGEYWLDELRGYDYFIPTECRSDEG